MASNEYHFVTHWRVQGTIDEIGQIFGDVGALARWWPSVYLEVRETAPGDPDGVGREVDLYTKGWLPYTLRWQFRVVEVQQGRSIRLEARGDFIGRGVWTFAPDGEWVDITYDWRVRADKPLLRWLSPLLKPVFSANHHWAMARGEESLWLELARRRAATAEERAGIPPPPPATTSSPWPLALALLGALGAAAGMAYAARRRLRAV